MVDLQVMVLLNINHATQVKIVNYLRKPFMKGYGNLVKKTAKVLLFGQTVPNLLALGKMICALKVK